MNKLDFTTSQAHMTELFPPFKYYLEDRITEGVECTYKDDGTKSVTSRLLTSDLNTLSCDHVLTLAEEYRFFLMNDFIRNGVPVEMYSPTVTFNWRNNNYIIAKESLRILDGYRFPLKGQEYRTDYYTPHALGLAREFLQIPAFCNGKATIIHAQHLCASMLVDIYARCLRDYSQVLSDINSRLAAFSIGHEENDTVMLIRKINDRWKKITDDLVCNSIYDKDVFTDRHQIKPYLMRVKMM